MGAKFIHDQQTDLHDVKGEKSLPHTTTEAELDAIEIAGTIKWFDVSKGFGFIVPDDGTPDVLLHVTCLRRDGYQTAYEGARIVCEEIGRAHV